MNKLLYQIHGWLGLNFGLVLFIICLSGSFAVVSHEIDWLCNPAIRVSPEGERLPWSALLNSAEQYASGSKVRIYYAGALYKDPDAMTAMSQGNLEMGWLVAGKTAATDIWLSIPGQPGVLTTAGAVHDLINQPTGKMLQKRLKDKHNIEMF